MICTLIQLTEEQYKFLREKAAKYQVSIAARIPIAFKFPYSASCTFR